MALVLATEDKAQARRLQRLAAAGQLRRIYPGIYTDDLVQPLESIVSRELFALCSQLATRSIISHRSSLEGGRPTPAGSLFLTGANRRDFELPGVKLRMVKGAGPWTLISASRPSQATHSSRARLVLCWKICHPVAALPRSVGHSASKRSRTGWPASSAATSAAPPTRLADPARSIARPLGLESEFKQLDKIIGALLGTQRTHLTAPAAIARAAGKPYDDTRVTLFRVLATELQANPLQVPSADPDIDANLQAFVETYFSNYIEGTEFEIEEAHDIVVQGRPLKYREDDSHDILGTYGAILESKANPIISQRFQDFARHLQNWNREVIESRQSKNPGEFKTVSNRAGNTAFVAPDLVLGTLEKGYESIMSAATPANRAALAMFVVAEVHPFTDGNGRTARLAMNPFLTEAGFTRIIIPTVYRDDHVSALKAMFNQFAAKPIGSDARQRCALQSLGEHEFKGKRIRRLETIERPWPSRDRQTSVRQFPCLHAACAIAKQQRSLGLDRTWVQDC